MKDEWTDHLSDFLNGDLEPADRRKLETHLEHCADCTTTLEQLRQVVSWARSHPGHPPPKDVWPSIATGIRGSRRKAGSQVRPHAGATRERVTWLPATMPQALAAGIALTVVAAVSWWVARTTLPGPIVQEVTTVRWAPNTGPSPRVTILAAERYSAAIAELEALIADEGRIDTATVRVVESRLAIIDRAIDEARTALAKDPNSDYLADHFANMMRRKLALLRTVARS